MAHPCASFDCDNTVSEHMESDLCFSCRAQILKDGKSLFEDLDKVLRLEAEFVAYCEDKGLPNPHE